MSSIVEVITTCPFCGEEHSVPVFEADYIKWQNGTLAQIAFPYLTATAREQLISGLCPTCQKEFFDKL